jgi:hypothetical protein
MIVIYRLCDIPSTNPSPLFQNDKVALNKYCLNMFLKAFKDVDMSIVFLCDHTGDYDDYLSSVVKHEFRTEYSKQDINYTYLRSIDIAKESNDDVLFQECDYLYKEGAGKEMLEAVKNFGFISPYDHPDKYPSDGVKIRLFNGRHWRNAPSTTMTYMATKENIKNHSDLLSKHGYLDHQMWVELTHKTGKELWTPIPALATHMVKAHISPGMDIWTSK